MKIDFSKPIKNLDGSPVKNFETLRQVATHALSVFMPGDEKLEPNKKVARGHLAMTIYSATEPVEITPEALTDLRALIARAFGSIVVAQAWDLTGDK